MNSLRPGGALALLAVALATTSCASGAPAARPATTSAPAAGDPAEYEVTGLLHIDDGNVNVCSIELESYPPQCGGSVPVRGLDTAALEPGLFETASGVTWGWARLVGTFDDGALALTHEPMPPVTPTAPPDETIPTESPNAAELADIAETIATQRRSDLLSVGPNGDVVEVLVPLDRDGSIQATFDDEFGAGTVVVDSWLAPWRD